MTDASPRAGANLFARHRKKTVFVLLVVFAALFDVSGASVYDLAVESAERRRMAIEASKAAQTKPDEGDERLYRIRSISHDHDLLPNASVERATWGGRFYPVRTNSLGFRDRTVREVPLAKHPRLLLMGDSFTEGVGLRYEDTFAARLEDELARGDGIDVLNAGVSSYCPSIYLRKTKLLLEDTKLEFDTLAVFLDISDIHDEGDWYESVYWQDDKPPPPPPPGTPVFEIAPAAMARADAEEGKRSPSLLWRHSLAARGLITLFGTPPPSPVGSTHSQRSRWTVNPVLFERYGRKGLRRCGLAMDQLVELCRAHKVAVVLVVYPWPDQIDAHDDDSVHVRYWRAWAARHDVPFFDLFPLFVNDEDKRLVYERYFLAGDCHWNPAGHRLVADEFLRRFRALRPR